MSNLKTNYVIYLCSMNIESITVLKYSSIQMRHLELTKTRN